ncbi:MAG TPA: hypothetical protein VG125_27965 [Pirellulales bacterium]|jgi:hypothetical protein|nr:hypothetical protein [Pirellulales bacterium]
MTRYVLACVSVAALLVINGAAFAQQRSTRSRWVSAYDAQSLAGAPVTRPAVIRNLGPVDLGGGGTRVGNGDAPAVDTTLYPNYYNPSFIGYNNYASYGGIGYGGRPLGWTNYPPWLYRPRYLYPYRYYPLRTGFSVYNPYFYNNTYYGGYASPFWTGYGGFSFPYQFGAYGTGGAGSPYGAFGYPYRYGIFGYPYPGMFSQPYNYSPSPAYFMYPGLGGLYVPPGFVGQPGYYGYAGYGLPVSPPAYTGGFYW